MKKTQQPAPANEGATNDPEFDQQPEGDADQGGMPDGNGQADDSHQGDDDGDDLGIEISDEIDLQADTLRGDIRDVMLDRIKNMRKPWAQMSNYEQSETIAGFDRVAKKLVRDAVRLVAAENQVEVTATLEQVAIKDGIKATLTLSRHAQGRHELADAVGQEILIVVLDSDRHDSERREAKADPDQNPLPLGDDAGDDKPVFDTTTNGADQAAEGQPAEAA